MDLGFWIQEERPDPDFSEERPDPDFSSIQPVAAVIAPDAT